MKILLVDDDQGILTVYHAALQKAGYEVVTAANGQDGINRAHTEGPSLILLDQVLPDISGNEIIKQLKQEESTKEIPIMVLSNFSQEELVKEAINSGAIDYIFKYQVEIQDVINKVNETIKKGE